MRYGVVLASKAMLVVLFIASLAAQVLVIPAVAGDVRAAFPEVGGWATAGAVWAAAVVVCGQVVLVLVWHLLSSVSDNDIFQRSAIAPVTAIIWCAATVVVLMVAGWLTLTMLAFATPGAMLVIGATGLVAATFTLIMVVMRALLRAAISLREEIDEVI